MKPSLAANASPEDYADAMLKCQGYAPSCSDAQKCQHDGVCFTRDGMGFAAARKAIKDLIDAENDVTKRCWLKLGLDALDHNRFLERRTIDAMRVILINRRVRKEYGFDQRREGR